MDEIKRELIELNFNIDSVGIIYWIKAIRLIQQNPNILNIMEIYKTIGQRYNKSSNAVERAMRVSISTARKNIQEKYNYNREIKNHTFLNLIRYELL